MIFGPVGAWRSLVAHLLWEQRVGGSNPSAPTNVIKKLLTVLNSGASWRYTQGYTSKVMRLP